MKFKTVVTDGNRNNKSNNLLTFLKSLLPLDLFSSSLTSLFSSSSSSSFIFVVFCLIINCLSAVKCNNYENEFYSSVAGLERLLMTEQILLTDLKDYVATTKQQIALLEK